MKDLTVFRLFIATPSDVDKERTLVCALIEAWNNTHSSDGFMAEAIHWSTHHRAMGGDEHPQKVIDRRLLDGYDCDVLVGIFGNRLGTKTDTHPSGTVEEIEYFSQKNGKENVMLFFGEWDIPRGTKQSELKRLKAFQKSVSKWATFQPIPTRRSFAKLVRPHIDKVLNELMRNAGTRGERANHRQIMIGHGQRLEATWRQYEPEWTRRASAHNQFQCASMLRAMVGVTQDVLHARSEDDNDERWSQLSDVLGDMREVLDDVKSDRMASDKAVAMMTHYLDQLKYTASSFQS